MPSAAFKFERFSDPEFPIYLSAQSGRQELVSIHYHTSAELLQVTAGRVRLLVGSTHLECGAGEFLFIPPGAVHEAVSLTPDAALRGVICDPSLMDVAPLQPELTALLDHMDRRPYAVAPGETVHTELCACMDRLHALYGDRTLAGRLRISSCLLQITAVLIQHFALEDRAADRSLRKLRPVLDYLREHYAEKIHISQLSRIIHVCDDRLIRLFREATGETPVSYLTHLRLEACIKLLSTTDESLAAIAEQTGFGTATYMSRVFRQHLGTTPRGRGRG